MRTEYKKAIFKIEKGDRTGETYLDHIPSGDRVSAFVEAYDTSTGEQTNVMLGLDENGNEVLTPLPSSMFDGKNGQIDERMLVLNYIGGSTLQIKASTMDLEPAREPIVVHCVFKITTGVSC